MTLLWSSYRRGQRTFRRSPIARMVRYRATSLSFPVWIASLFCLLLLAVFGWGPNFGLVFLSLAVLFAGSWLCWRPGEPGVALVLFGYQWVQASTALFAANIQGVSINAVAQLAAVDMEQATALSLLGLLSIFAAFRLTAGKAKNWVVARARDDVQILTVQRLAVVYGGVALAATFLLSLGSLSQGLTQPAVAFTSVKDAMFIIVAYAAFTRGGTFRTLFLCVFAIEFAASLGGYFSSFQQVVLYTFIAITAANVRINVGRILVVGLFIGFVLFLGVIWSAIKVEYRTYLNSGTGQQVVTVPWYEAIGKLAGLVATVDSDDLIVGADMLVRRLPSVEFFAGSLGYVPAVVPHTHGQLWGNAILHPFTPRLLFPDKPVIDSSAQTNQFSGIRVAGREQGAQISIGYMGESYIDFGRIGMFIPLIVFGAIAGFVYRRVLTLPRFAGLISFGLSVPLLMHSYYLNAETIKIVGAFVVNAIAIFALHAFVSRFFRRTLFGKGTLRARQTRPLIR